MFNLKHQIFIVDVLQFLHHPVKIFLFYKIALQKHPVLTCYYDTTREFTCPNMGVVNTISGRSSWCKSSASLVPRLSDHAEKELEWGRAWSLLRAEVVA